MHTQHISALPRGTSLSRYVQSLLLSKGDLAKAALYAERWRDSPAVMLTYKAFVAPLTVSGASPLTVYGIGPELVESINAASIIGKLRDRMRRVPFRVTVAREVSSASSAWVAESNAISVQALTYDSINVEAFKIGTIVDYSKELARFSSPSAELEIRNRLIAGAARYLDQQFLTITNTRIADVRPASITNAGGVVVSTGSTNAQIETDLNSMLNLLGSENDPVWVGRTKTMKRLATLFGAVGMGPNILGFPFVASANSPAQIVLADAANILLADDGVVDIDYSEEASLLYDDNPQQSPMTTSLVSLFQRDQVGIKVIREIAWLAAHDSSVVSMLVSY